LTGGFAVFIEGEFMKPLLPIILIAALSSFGIAASPRKVTGGQLQVSGSNVRDARDTANPGLVAGAYKVGRRTQEVRCRSRFRLAYGSRSTEEDATPQISDKILFC
jgi:hypothetical protein